MTIYIATDLEGISGIYRWAQSREMTTAEYEQARRYLMEDIDAVIEGCRRGGARKILVRDSHDGAHNIIPELMNPHAEYICGAAAGQPVFPELEKCAAVILLGYHAMAGTADGLLAHTQSSASGRRYFYNNRETGEIGQHALMAGHHGIPVIMVSGDEATCREARDFLGRNLPTVAVKQGYATEYARLLPFATARKALSEQAALALRNLAGCTPYVIDRPFTGRLVFPNKELAEAHKPRSAATKRTDETSYERVFTDASDVLAF